MLAAVLLMAFVFAFAGEHKGEAKAEAKAETKWIDPHNCHFCQPLMAEEGLMEHCSWETFPIDQGILSVTHVAKGWGDKFDKADAAMQKLWEEFDPANPPQMCGMCQAYVDVWDPSIKMEQVQAADVRIGLTTSSDPEVVKKLQAIAARTTEEMKMMGEMMKKKQAAETD
jgi:hypothetical protein